MKELLERIDLALSSATYSNDEEFGLSYTFDQEDAMILIKKILEDYKIEKK